MEPEIPPAVAKRIAATVQSSRSEGTRKTFATAWRRSTGWREANGHVTLPAQPITVAAYLVDAADTRTEKGRAGLRCCHLWHVDGADQPSAPHYRPSVPVRARSGHRNLVLDPP